MHHPGRALLVVGAAGLIAAGGRVFARTVEAPAGSPPAGPHVALVDEYCLSCHDEDEKKGGLALDTVALQDVARHPDVWEKVVRKLRARQMPPVGEGAAGRRDLRRGDRVAGDVARPRGGGASESRAARRRSGGSRAPSTRTRSAICSRSTIDVASLLPADESSYGFDNVTVGDLSPTLLDRYISAAEKISRVAVGRPSRSPGGETIRIPPDLTQEEHLEGLPIGTRGGAVVPYTFPMDGEYEIQIRLTRDRDEHVEGLSEPHELELLARQGARAGVHA